MKPKITLKEGYESLPFPQKIKAYLGLCRPFTGIGSFLAGIFLVMFANPNFSWLHGLWVASVLTLLQFSGQSFNQANPEEIEIDRLNGKTYRPVVKGLIKPTKAFAFGLILSIVGISMAFILSFKFGVFAVIISFFALFYTAEPIRAKKRFLVNNIWQSFSRGFLPIVAIWCIFNNPFSLLPYLLASVVMIWVFGAQTTKDFPDIIGDRFHKINTLPVVLGKEEASSWTAFFMYASFFILLDLIVIGLIPVKYIALFVLAIPTAIISYALNKNLKLRITENNLAWNGFYITLGMWFILLGVIRCL